MPRRPKKYHYIYKTTCKVTGKFYVGMHSTDNLDDGYLGSGKILGYSRRKYGDESHEKVIIEFLPSREDLKAREKEIINEELLADPLNINLKYGGDGGGKFWSYKQQKNATISGNRSAKRDHATITKKILETKRDRGSGNYFGGRHDTFTGKKLSEEHKAKQRASFVRCGHQQGKTNSQFGTCWITDGKKVLKIKLEELNTYTQNGFVRGRKLST